MTCGRWTGERFGATSSSPCVAPIALAKPRPARSSSGPSLLGADAPPASGVATGSRSADTSTASSAAGPCSGSGLADGSDCTSAVGSSSTSKVGSGAGTSRCSADSAASLSKEEALGLRRSRAQLRPRRRTLACRTRFRRPIVARHAAESVPDSSAPPGTRPAHGGAVDGAERRAGRRSPGPTAPSVARSRTAPPRGGERSRPRRELEPVSGPGASGETRRAPRASAGALAPNVPAREHGRPSTGIQRHPRRPVGLLVRRAPWLRPVRLRRRRSIRSRVDRAGPLRSTESALVVVVSHVVSPRSPLASWRGSGDLTYPGLVRDRGRRAEPLSARSAALWVAACRERRACRSRVSRSRHGAGSPCRST